MTSAHRQYFIDLAMGLAEHCRRTAYPDLVLFYGTLIGAWIEVAGRPIDEGQGQ